MITVLMPLALVLLGTSIAITGCDGDAPTKPPEIDEVVKIDGCVVKHVERHVGYSRNFWIADCGTADIVSTTISSGKSTVLDAAVTPRIAAAEKALAEARKEAALAKLSPEEKALLNLPK